jgi:type II restriction enzyme
VEHVAVLDDVALALGAEHAPLLRLRLRAGGMMRETCRAQVQSKSEPRPVLPPHIGSASDLITARSVIRAGFMEQALAKTQRAASYVAEARELQRILTGVEDWRELLRIDVTSIQNQLLAVAGFSAKALNNLREYRQRGDLQPALEAVLTEIAQSTPDDWRAEIVFRFLLTKGDALGGSMRNLTGARAGAQLTQAIIEALERHAIPVLKTRITKKGKVSSLAWPDRLLLFDTKPKGIRNNVDAVLLDARRIAEAKKPAYELTDILACGELKGGIDPAGADEHWKTGGSAIDRIRTRLREKAPKLFFVGVAIEAAMADEIFRDLVSGELDYAANLTVQQQVTDLTDWLVHL